MVRLGCHQDPGPLLSAVYHRVCPNVSVTRFLARQLDAAVGVGDPTGGRCRKRAIGVDRYVDIEGGAKVLVGVVGPLPEGASLERLDFSGCWKACPRLIQAVRLR